jgi:hypothetical protein
MAALVLCTAGVAQLRDRIEHKRVDEDQSQTQSKKPGKRGPRAIGVIEFLPKGGARLVPVALWMDGRYYDASFYGANPAPMALQPETLYQAMSYGEPTGWFTVTTPEQVNGAWVAEGQWKPQQGTFDTKVAQQAVKQGKKKAPSPISDDSGPPVLRRSPSSGSSESTSSSGNAGGETTTASGGNNPPPGNDNSDRPVLRNSSPPSSGSSSSGSTRPTLGPDTSPSDSNSASAPVPPVSSTDDNDSDRPVLRKPSSPSPASSSSSSDSTRPTLGDASPANAQAPTAPPSPVSSPDENDPDRPALQRGKPSAPPSTSATAAVKTSQSASTTTATKTATASPKASTATNQPQSGRTYPAISDAGNYEIRSLLYAMTPAEKEERGRPMLALALDAVRNYRSKRQQENTVAKPAGKTAAKTPAKPENLTVGDYDLRAFDLDFSNSPTLVLTAKVAAPTDKAGGFAFDYFVTVVARVDINGEAQKVFSSVTDNNHLDAFPRLEIIDAVDADANGRGDLLFRQHSDSSVSYALYRVYPYQMVKVFEGGSNM